MGWPYILPFVLMLNIDCYAQSCYEENTMKEAWRRE